MIYLYIPFSEDNTQLLTIAQQWLKVYKEKDISSQILCYNESFVLPEFSNERIKIYILTYEGVNEKQLMSSANSHTASSLTLDQLINHLLQFKLPIEGTVDIKLCIKQSLNTALALDKVKITREDFLDSLQNHEFQNPRLNIVVEYSYSPFPGEVSDEKPAYRVISGNIFFKGASPKQNGSLFPSTKLSKPC